MSRRSNHDLTDDELQVLRAASGPGIVTTPMSHELTGRTLEAAQRLEELGLVAWVHGEGYKATEAGVERLTNEKV